LRKKIFLFVFWFALFAERIGKQEKQSIILRISPTFPFQKYEKLTKHLKKRNFIFSLNGTTTDD